MAPPSGAPFAAGRKHGLTIAMHLLAGERDRLTIPAMSRQRRKFPLVQALHALAALAVAFAHTAYDGLGMVTGAHTLTWLYHAAPWGGGVDVFFVISGFVIAWSSQALFGRSGAARIFLARRVAGTRGV
jgi:peptidoglycan/LPS O-acetylase OafA/YrhL